MTTIKTIPVDCLGGLDIRQGDTLHILASHGKQLVVEILRETSSQSSGSGAISQWLQTAKGSVKLESGESVDDARLDYYSKKYSLGS